MDEQHPTTAAPPQDTDVPTCAPPPEQTDPVIQIAQICHEANRAYCLTLGDSSQVAWEDAPEWQKQSAMNGVRLHLFNPDLPPSASHEAWMKEKLADGWRYGAVKDAEAKTHPCIVPWHELPDDQRRKDVLFAAIVEAMSAVAPQCEAE